MFFMLRDPEGGFLRETGGETVFCRREPVPIFVSSSEDKHGNKISVRSAESGIYPILRSVQFLPARVTAESYAFFF